MNVGRGSGFLFLSMYLHFFSRINPNWRLAMSSPESGSRFSSLLPCLLVACTRLYYPLCRSVRPSVRPSVTMFDLSLFYDFRTLLLLPNRTRQFSRVSGLVLFFKRLLFNEIVVN